MESLEVRSASTVARKEASAVPGLQQVMEDFRVAYPELSQEAIRRVLRLPTEINETPELPLEV